MLAHPPVNAEENFKGRHHPLEALAHNDLQRPSVAWVEMVQRMENSEHRK